MNNKGTYFSTKRTINSNGCLLAIDIPIVMGIINISPDSFYTNSFVSDAQSALAITNRMIKQGASIIDIGACSTRPGATIVTDKEEKKRLEPILYEIRNIHPDVIISLDTTHASIADWAVNKYKISIINDISAGEIDSAMFSTIAELKVPYILMHMQGIPENMQHKTDYKNLTADILKWFSEKIYKLRSLGVNDIIIDPGFGFGKTLEQNYCLLNQLDLFQSLELPILIGVSRKSMIYKLLNIEPENALNGSTVIHTIALQKGASILRVHDVKEAVETINICMKLNEPV